MIVKSSPVEKKSDRIYKIDMIVINPEDHVNPVKR